jgi:hypothetical protein
MFKWIYNHIIRPVKRWFSRMRIGGIVRNLNRAEKELDGLMKRAELTRAERRQIYRQVAKGNHQIVSKLLEGKE